MRVAVTTAYSRSLHSIAVIDGLAKRGHDVVMLIEPKITLRRLRSYLRILGPAKLKRKIMGRLLPGSGDDEVRPMQDYFRAHSIRFRSTAQVCKAHGVKRVLVRNLNDAESLAALGGADLDLIVYSGGGIVRPATLAIPRLGVLNAHGGPLPKFRGMNAGEWALLFGVTPEVTTHFIDVGIDTGPVLLSREVTGWSSISQMRGLATRVGVELLLETVQSLAEGRLKARPQSREHGRQYYVMADPLLEIISGWIAEGTTPRVPDRV